MAHSAWVGYVVKESEGRWEGEREGRFTLQRDMDGLMDACMGRCVISSSMTQGGSGIEAIIPITSYQMTTPYLVPRTFQADLASSEPQVI